MAARILNCIFLLALWVVPCSSQVQDVLGWQDSRWEMSTAEIQAIFKSNVTKLPKREDFGTVYVDYAILNYDIEGGKYTVFFQMDKKTEKLSQVLIRSDNKLPSELYFNKLESLLISKYGSPGYKNDDRKPVISLDRQWTFSTTTIELSYRWDGLVEFGSQTTIRYFPTKKRDTNKI